MATLPYKLQARKMSVGPKAGKIIYSAAPVLGQKVSFHELCKELADDSTVGTADVKAVLDRLSKVIVRNLKKSLAVDCGDLGIFRPSLTSKSVEDPKEFKTSMIAPARVVFTPRMEFKNSLRECGFVFVRPGDDKPDEGQQPSTPNPGNSGGGGGQGSIGGGL